MIELLHPVTVAIAVLCAPVATIAVSGTIDYLAQRQHVREAGAPRAKPGGDRRPASARE